MGRTIFVRKEELVHIRERVKNYKTLKRLVKQCVDLTLKIVEAIVRKSREIKLLF